ncbi:hypothetical protein EBR21_17565, partial [bacterium]|nr:hypothetical protein [bacterium]
MDNPRSWGRNSLLLMFLTVIGCSKGSVGGSALNLDSTSVQFSGFQLTVNISDQTASGVTSDSGELKYSLKGCESRTSDETTMPFVLSKQIKPIRLKAYSSLKDCSIHIESLNFAGNTFLPAQQAISSYVGSKTGIGLYMSSAEPESSWALIPSKKFSVDPETNLISINLKLVKQTNVQVGVSGEMPPLLVLSEDSPL